MISSLILAGGQSSRLGIDKAFLEINGQILIERTVAKMAQLCQEVIIVTDLPEKFTHLEARLVSDIYPGKGALGGIYSGLKAACHHHSLVVACDMPFLNFDLLHFIIDLAPEQDVVIPRVNGLLEPLHAIYSKNCLGPIEELLARGGRKIIDFFPKVRVRYVEEDVVNRFDPQHFSFININTPADLERVKRLVSLQSQQFQP